MAEAEKVSIAEKVRFWEEQDKINQALIPRVVEMHETLGRISARMDNVSSDIAAAEARVMQRVREEMKSIGDPSRTLQQLRLMAYSSLALSVIALALAVYGVLKP